MDLDLPEETRKLLEKALGSLSNIKNKKSILAMVVGSTSAANFDELFFIRKTIETPEFKEDTIVFNYLRAMSEGTITTAKTIREEEMEGRPQKIDFSLCKEMEESFYQGGKKMNISDVRTRPYLVLTNDMSKTELMSVNFYKEPHVTFMIPKTPSLAKSIEENDHELKEFLIHYNVVLIDRSFENVGEASKYMSDTIGMNSVVSEAGLLTYWEYLMNPDIGVPFDCLVLTIFCGKLGNWAKTKFPSLKNLLSKFKIAYQSDEIQSANGPLYFLTLVPFSDQIDTSVKKKDSAWYKQKSTKTH